MTQPNSQYYTDSDVRTKIDNHLSKIASLNANIGIDSSNLEVETINSEIKNHLLAIMELDMEFYKVINPQR